jgi:transcriptional regulator with XRE-family HTH domain
MRSAIFDGTRYRELREQAEMTLNDVAMKTADEPGGPVHSSFVGAVERGVRQPSAKNAAALCRAISIDRDQVIHPKTEEPCSESPHPSPAPRRNGSGAAGATEPASSSTATTNEDARARGGARVAAAAGRPKR